MSNSPYPVSRALLSVSDKRGIVEFAERLAARGIEILSTGGTANVLRAQDIGVTGVADYTGFPEILDGRVKTLHPRIHAGLLGRPGVDDEAFAAHKLDHIELLVVNLYPFGKTVARADCTRDEAVEQIDIGGPAMLRAAAKNHRWVTAIVDPDDYAKVATEIEARGGVGEATRRRLACKAFRHTAEYDTAIADYLLAQEQSEDPTPFGEVLDLEMRRRDELRYGENPHQRAAFYVERTAREPSVSTAAQIQGKALSFNNIADADAALECVKQFEEPACVIVKHANPCGVAVADDVLGAYKRAYSADPKSAFGGIIALNRSLDAVTAAEILNRQFVEVIIAPAVGEEAREALASKRNVRVLETGIWEGEPAPSLDYRRVRGGMLVQDTDLGRVGRDDLEVATRRAPTEQEMDDLLFAWTIVKFVKSNAIVYARERMSIGIGAGQMSRVYSARIGAEKAAEEGLTLQGAAMASDAFFPFRDSIEDAAQHGITSIIQPGGSMRDEEVIAAADEHGIAMVLTRMRHFRH